MSRPDPYKTLQVDPEAEDEVIVAAYRRLARKYHPDRGGWRRVGGADGGAQRRMGGARRARARAAYDRERDVGRRPGARGARRPTWRPAARDRVRRRAAECRADRSRPRPAGDRVARLDERPIDGRRWLRPVDAQRRWHGCRRPAAGQPIRQRPELRSLCRLVPRRDRAGGPRVPRVARPDAHRPAVSRRDRRSPAGAGRRRSAEAESADRRGLFRRR